MYNKHNKHASRWSKAHSVSQLAGTPFASVFWEHFHRAVALRAGAHCLCEVVQVDIVEAEQVVAGKAPDGGHLRMVGKRPSTSTERLGSSSPALDVGALKAFQSALFRARGVAS